MGEDETKELLKEVHLIAVNLAVMKQKQDDNHVENQADIKILFDKVSKLDNLPCSAHIEKFSGYDKHVEEGDKYRKDISGKIFKVFLTIIFACVSIGVAWGMLTQKVDAHIEYSTERWEHCCEEHERGAIQ